MSGMNTVLITPHPYGDRRIRTGKNPVAAEKKTHNVKNNLLCSPQKRILWLSETFDGHVHDKKIADEQPLSLPAGITLWQDTFYRTQYRECNRQNADKETQR
jgi:hypothetical protein